VGNRARSRRQSRAVSRELEVVLLARHAATMRPCWRLPNLDSMHRDPDLGAGLNIVGRVEESVTLERWLEKVREVPVAGTESRILRHPRPGGG
jgi:hypothetical protein